MSNLKKFIKPTIYVVLILFFFLLPLFVKETYFIHVLILVGINIILASSLRTIATTGQISLGHAGFMAIGGYTTAILVMKLGISSWAALLLGGIASAIIALLVGFPFVRVKRVYFAMLTLFLGEIIRLVITELRAFTGGTSGLLNIPPPDSISIGSLFIITFDTKVAYYYFILVLVLITLLILYRIESSRIGRTLYSIQQSDFVAESVGINVISLKVFVWCVGGFFAGIAGGFYAQFVRNLTPDSFGVMQAIYIVVYMVIGGRRKFFGAILGASILTILPEIFRVLKEYEPFVFVGVLFLVIFLLPGGLVDLPQVITAQIRKHRKVESNDA
ncbi:MAG: branched-chain amino acid ABC transporter permease [Dehalococcoidales bacterium]|jgi:branched-chain amino acid transport system permease protein